MEEVKHSFSTYPMCYSFSSGKVILDVWDLQSIVGTKYFDTKYDGYVYINSTSYKIEGLIQVGVASGFSENNSSIIGMLSYGNWILRDFDTNTNVNTSDIIGTTILTSLIFSSFKDDSLMDYYASKYNIGDSNINIETFNIVQGVNIQSIDLYLSYNYLDVLNYINLTYNCNYSFGTIIDCYLILSIDDYQCILLSAGTKSE